ncbi:MAG TPA: hypothetical protein VKY85_01140 [Candidatus Angelobacter sp.]|nr:hypothetical protein [Candidatus Angelobacter sp.]
MTQDRATLPQLLSKLAAIQLRFPGPKDKADAWKPALTAVSAKCQLIIQFTDTQIPLFKESNELYSAIAEARKRAIELRLLCRQTIRVKNPIALAKRLGDIRMGYSELGSNLSSICLLTEPSLAPTVELVLVTA